MIECNECTQRIPLTVSLPITSGEPGPDKRLRSCRCDGSVQRLARVATRQTSCSLSFCISIAHDLTTCVSCTYACACTANCSLLACLLACLLAWHASRHNSHARQKADRTHRPTATVAKQPSLPKLLAPSPLGALSTEYEGGVLIPHC